MRINEDTIEHRLVAVRKVMRAGRIRQLLLTSEANVRYVTGFAGADSWALVTNRQVQLLTDSRYTEQAARECPSCLIAERAGSLAKTVGEIVRRSRSGDLAVEERISMGDFERLGECVGAGLRTVSGVAEQVRRTKDPGEVSTIKAAALRATRALERTLPLVRVGMSENELAGLLDLEIRRESSTNSFDTIVAFGANGSRPHHQPGRRKLRPNDAILIDFGARYEGYCSDITRCFTVGKVFAKWAEVFDVVEKAQKAAISAIRDGVRIEEVDTAARKVIADHGLPVYGHGTGHGLGLEIHENPFMKPGTDEVLRAGDVITVEPGVYIPGRLGIRIEDDVLVTADGCRLLTGRCGHRPNSIRL